MVLRPVFLKFLKSKNSLILYCFQEVSKEVFVCQNSLSLFVFKVLENQRKINLWKICFVLFFSYIFRVFPNIFSLRFLFQTLLFLTYLSYQFKSIFMIFVLWENLFVVFQDYQELFLSLDHQVVTFLSLLCVPSFIEVRALELCTLRL